MRHGRCGTNRLDLAHGPGQLGSHSPGYLGPPKSLDLPTTFPHDARADVLARHTRYGLVGIQHTPGTSTEQGQPLTRSESSAEATGSVSTGRLTTACLPQLSSTQQHSPVRGRTANQRSHPRNQQRLMGWNRCAGHRSPRSPFRTAPRILWLVEPPRRSSGFTVHNTGGRLDFWTGRER